jgi:hypothetical protein
LAIQAIQHILQLQEVQILFIFTMQLLVLSNLFLQLILHLKLKAHSLVKIAIIS